MRKAGGKPQPSSGRCGSRPRRQWGGGIAAPALQALVPRAARLPRPGTPIPPPTLRASARAPPSSSPCPPASAARDQGRTRGPRGRAGEGPEPRAGEGRRPWARAPTAQLRTGAAASAAPHPDDAMSATRPGPVAACASSALSRSAGRGLRRPDSTAGGGDGGEGPGVSGRTVRGAPAAR